MTYNTNEVLKILKISRPTLYKIIKKTNFHPRRTSERGRYVFTMTDVILFKTYLKTYKFSKNMFLYDLYDDIMKILLIYSKQFDQEEGEKIFNNFFKSYKKGIVLNKGKLN